jgi:hypothetical protein
MGSGDRIKPPQGGGTADGYGFGRSPMDAGTVSNPHREAAQLMVMDLAVRPWIVAWKLS